jgi:NAD(P)H-dependent FMN reductase
MSETTHLLGVIGSPRVESTSAAFVHRVVSAAGGRGVGTRLVDLRRDPLPFFEPGAPRSVAIEQALVAVRWADVLVLGTPDYHGGPSGSLKNFLDHFWREFGGKLFGVVVASNEKGLTVQDHLRTSIRQCYAWSLPYGVGAADSAVDSDGTVSEPRVAERLDMMARDLVTYGGLIAAQRRADQALPHEPLLAGFMARVRG